MLPLVLAAKTLTADLFRKWEFSNHTHEPGESIKRARENFKWLKLNEVFLEKEKRKKKKKKKREGSKKRKRRGQEKKYRGTQQRIPPKYIEKSF